MGLGKKEEDIRITVKSWNGFRPLAGNGLGKEFMRYCYATGGNFKFPPPCGEWVRRAAPGLTGMWRKGLSFHPLAGNGLESQSASFTPTKSTECFRPLSGNGLGKLFAITVGQSLATFCFRPLAGNGLGKAVTFKTASVRLSPYFRSLAGNGLGNRSPLAVRQRRRTRFRPLAGNRLGKLGDIGTSFFTKLSFPSPCGEWIRKIRRILIAISP